MSRIGRAAVALCAGPAIAFGPIGAASAQVTSTYNYDELGRLQTATDTQGTASTAITYSYDAPGNRTAQSVSQSPVANPVSLMVAFNSPATTVNYSYSGGAPTSAAATTPTQGRTSVNGTTITYTPPTGFSGSDSFQYTLTNAVGTSAPATVSVTVNPAPPVANAFSQSVPYQTATALSLNITGTAASVAVSSAPSHGTYSLNGKTITYTPATGYTGGDSLQYTATNAGGTSAPATVTITVAVQPPTANSDSVSTPSGTSVSFNPVTNDTDPQGLSLTLTGVGTPAHGTVSPSGNTVTYTPSSSYTGPDSFTYSISDGHGGTATGTINATVTARAPTANADSISTPSGTAVSFNPVSNDTDPQGYALTLTGVGTPSHGTASYSGNTVTYTPSSSYTGSDSFTYTISDGHGGIATGAVNATVTVRNPTANADSVTTAAGSAVNFNPVSNDTDPQGYALTLAGLGTPAHGTASYSGNTVTYTPNSSYTGSDSFTYTVADGQGGTATGTVTVTINPPNPTCTPFTQTAATQGHGIASTSFPPLTMGKCTDPSGYTLSVTSVTYGSLSNNLVTASFPVGTTVVGYAVSNGHGGTTSSTITWVVQ